MTVHAMLDPIVVPERQVRQGHVVRESWIRAQLKVLPVTQLIAFHIVPLHHARLVFMGHALMESVCVLLVTRVIRVQTLHVIPHVEWVVSARHSTHAHATQE